MMRLLLAAAALANAILAPARAQTYRPEFVREPAVTGFGSALAVGDGEIFIAEPLTPDRPGVVYVYRRDGSGTWREAARLLASNAETADRFGRAIAVDGRTLLVGATTQDSSRGAAYVFWRDDAGNWSEAARLRASDGSAGDALGRAVALSGDFALVSALGYKERAGVVYVFRRDPGTGGWSEHSRLVAGDAAPGDFFGAAVAIDGDLALVGAPLKSERTGVAYLFRHDRASDTWREEARLGAAKLQANDQFGSAVALRGSEALVAAPLHSEFRGAVFAYRRDAATGGWAEGRRIVLPDGAPQHRFGSALAFDAGVAWIGAPGAQEFRGTLYHFRWNESAGDWVEAAKLVGGQLEQGDSYAGAVAVRGSVAAVGIVNADYGEGTAAILERAAGGAWTEVARVWSEPAGMDPVTGGEVDCREGSAAAFDCSEVDLVSFLPVRAIGGGRGVEVNDVWGWTDPDTETEYALVGRVDGTAFVDISDPENPVYVGELPKTAGSPGSTWRDIKVYRDHAFIVADGAGRHGLQVFDLRRLRAVKNPPVTFAETAHYDRIHSAHNIVINEETGFAFTVGNSAGGETCGGGLHMINVQEPDRPTFAGCFADTATGRQRTGYTHDAQCVIYHGPDEAHRGREICFGSNETALSIADVTDKANPVPISRAEYPNVGYTHQGWLTEDHRYFFMDDELDELNGLVSRTRTLIFDVTDLDDPVLLKEHLGTTAATDHNLYIKGNLLYQSNYVAGLRILDIADVENPVEVAYFDTVPYGENEPGFGGSWSNYPFFRSGVIVVTSGREGLFLLKKQERPLTP